ncbi:hypothetical protein [Desulfitobacterium chlororespirans]|uniref:Uncharacterized protein n=1 Tax=Desulfitobacterium chlororespirans DSM 11544 TaxID=1121395 RepID=A0A1M7T4F2_9FIRM|nr:hypothetical protein [Desulfitobacterium chlororespirans]SHN65609.1 hypothetical protein SAMN02745215_01541 [Desulfitobacterium chlororespirans DSM 11544]
MIKKLALGVITAALLIVGTTAVFAETNSSAQPAQTQGCYGPQCGASPCGPINNSY